jgi:hypothetical protein
VRIQPIVFVWQRVDAVGADGEVHRELAMVPIPRYRNIAARQYGEEGGEHTLMPFEERSMASHNQFFAAVNDHYDNLPERVWYLTDQKGEYVLGEDGHKVVRWPTSTHFRRDLLIRTGWCDVKEFECANRDHAKKLGLFFRAENPYAKVELAGFLVRIKVASSQKIAAMGKADFEQSKKDVLDLAESLTGVPRSVAMKNAGRAA